MIFTLSLISAPTHPLPNIVVEALSISTLLIVGFFIEKYYVSRLTVFSNGVALIAFLNGLDRLDWLLIGYGLIGFIAAIIGIVFYIRQKELPVEYYEIVFYTYSSAPIGVLILLTIIFFPSGIWLIPSFLIGSVINSKVLLSLRDQTVPVEELPLAIPVTQWYVNRYYELRNSF